MKTIQKPKLGQVYDARKHRPPVHREVLVFRDVVFAWVLAVATGDGKYASRWQEYAALYWTSLPSRSLLVLERLAARRQN